MARVIRSATLLDPPPLDPGPSLHAIPSYLHNEGCIRDRQRATRERAVSQPTGALIHRCGGRGPGFPPPSPLHSVARGRDLSAPGPPARDQRPSHEVPCPGPPHQHFFQHSSVCVYPVSRPPPQAFSESSSQHFGPVNRTILTLILIHRSYCTEHIFFTQAKYHSILISIT